MSGGGREDEGDHATLEIKGIDAALLAKRPPAGPRVSIIVYHREGSTVVPLRENTPVVVGRGPPAEVTIADRSLSRQHARFHLLDGAVTVEDLGSTNGTRINGETIARCRVAPGDRITMGDVTAALHVLADAELSLPGLLSHDAFAAAVEEELARARFFRRQAALIVLRALDNVEGGIRRWCPRVRESLRAVDRIGLYSTEAVEILMPEAGRDEASSLAQLLLSARPASEPALAAGVASFPSCATSAHKLTAVVHAAARAATAAVPLKVAADEGTHREAHAPREEPSSAETGGFVARSPAMQSLLLTVERVARPNIPILIIGETGSGKEVIARALHQKSPRQQGALHVVNCGAIPAQLVESTLFGHERGAFTGATHQRKGVFEAADGGTVFLDEIGELPMPAQAALLRVLETKRILRVGSTQEIPVDVRVVSATHRDLERMAASGGFREDLLFRLNAVTLVVPPLRDRPEDIPALADHFVKLACEAAGASARTIASDVMDLLSAYTWPGNVRELRNAIERAVAIAEGPAITSDDLPERVRTSRSRAAEPAASATWPAPARGGGVPDHGDLKEIVRSFEAEVIRAAIAAAGGNKAEAARRLGLPYRTLIHKIRTLGAGEG